MRTIESIRWMSVASISDNLDDLTTLKWQQPHSQAALAKMRLEAQSWDDLLCAVMSDQADRFTISSHVNHLTIAATVALQDEARADSPNPEAMLHLAYILKSATEFLYEGALDPNAWDNEHATV